jgi:hypothetical protein
LHWKLGAQSEFDAQPTVHTAFTQAWGEQSVVGPPTHLPLPSHFEVPTMIDVFPPAALQAGAAQIVPAA